MVLDMVFTVILKHTTEVAEATNFYFLELQNFYYYFSLRIYRFSRMFDIISRQVPGTSHM